jgi:hypothetical protein
MDSLRDRQMLEHVAEQGEMPWRLSTQSVVKRIA